MAAAISMAFQEARIEKAFERFWSQFWSTVGHSLATSRRPNRTSHMPPPPTHCSTLTLARGSDRYIASLEADCSGDRLKFGRSGTLWDL
ncbi:Hypothetical predicted protein [Pelobates cultripes]|uniref:Uncharacterized protein n=1 Tax=Pelobates cultripes TaxID=61616 RepID=A0AAD1WVD0_PELCU|nr:Hypothetical predicted protein [Pelobates cultripes]